MTSPLVVHSDVAESNASGRLTAFSSLLHDVYAASADPALWHQALDAIARAMRAVQALLFTPYVGPHHGGFFYAWNIKEQDLLLYSSKYIDHDLWAHSAQRNGFMTEGAVAFDDELVPREELLASVYYREFLSPMSVARLCSGVIFAGAPGLPSTVLSIYRGPHDAPFGQEDRELMLLLMPHLSRSLGLMHRLGLARHQEASMRAALDRLSVGVLLLDQRLPDGLGTDLLPTLLDRCPAMKVLLVTASDSDDVLTRAIEAGAAGFIPKGERAANLVRAVRAAADDEPRFARRPHVAQGADEFIPRLRLDHAVGRGADAQRREVGEGDRLDLGHVRRPGARAPGLCRARSSRPRRRSGRCAERRRRRRPPWRSR